MKKFNLRAELEPEYWKDEVEFIKCLVAMDRDRRKAHLEKNQIILKDDDLDDEEDFEDEFEEDFDDDFDDDDDDLDDDDYTERARDVQTKVDEGEGIVSLDPVWICSKCGKGRHVYGKNLRAYLQWIACPNCGAIMVERAY